jgi:hypothetical protein
LTLSVAAGLFGHAVCHFPFSVALVVRKDHGRTVIFLKIVLSFGQSIIADSGR